MAGDSKAKIKKLVPEILDLVKLLPTSLPLAKENDPIAHAFSRVEKNDWESFNTLFDTLYAESKRVNGRLNNVLFRGPLGMQKVCDWMEKGAKEGWIEYAAALPKYQRIRDELAAVVVDKSNRSKNNKNLQESDDDEDRNTTRRKGAKRNDAAYKPAKRPLPDDDSDADADIFDSGDEEIIKDNTELSRKLAAKRSKGKEAAAKRVAAEKQTRKTKGLPKKKSSGAALSYSDVEAEVDDGEESDGGSGLRNAQEKSAQQGARRGPVNQSVKTFHEPVAITEGNGTKKWKFVCKKCAAVRTVKRTVSGDQITIDDEPTLPLLTNISSHASKCKDTKQAGDEAKKPKDTDDFNYEASAKLMEGWLKEGDLDPDAVITRRGFLRLFAAWILDESLPWTTGEAPALRLLFKYLHIHQQLPSDTTVRNQLAHIFAELLEKVSDMYTHVKSRVSYQTDTWTTRQMVYTFACTIGSFVSEDWELIHNIIDFQALDEKDHVGVYAGKAFVEGARKVGGLDKFLAMTTDNASANTPLVEMAMRLILTKYNRPVHGDAHIRCILHSMNLTVQDTLAAIDEAPNPDDEDYFNLDKEAPLHWDPEEDEEQLAFDREADDVEDDPEDVNMETDGEEETLISEISKQSCLKRLRFICTKIVSSPQRRGRFRKACRAAYKDKRRQHLMVIRDVRTRWNWTFCMVRRALELKQGINTWTAQVDNGAYSELKLKSDDWTMLEKIKTMLEPFYAYTKDLSTEKTPTLPLALPYYKMMEDHYKSIEVDFSYPPELRYAASQGLKKLLKYADMARGNQFNKLATMLHPKFRSTFFLASAGKDEQDKAEMLFAHVADSYLASEPRAGAPAAPNANAPEDNDSRPDPLAAYSFHANLTPDDLPMLTPEERLADEIKRYFSGDGGPCKTNHGSLLWWKANHMKFPTIARMARDYLAIAGSSVGVERVFSKSRHICADLRSSLKAETVRQALLAKVWIRSGLLEVNEPVRKRRKLGEGAEEKTK